jgi:hypothetical protein
MQGRAAYLIIAERTLGVATRHQSVHLVWIQPERRVAIADGSLSQPLPYQYSIVHLQWPM